MFPKLYDLGRARVVGRRLGVDGLRRNFELGPLGHDLAAGKGVGSEMVDGSGAAGRQSRG